MRGVDLVQPYLQAAKEVIARETGSDVSLVKVSLKKTLTGADGVSILIGVAGQIRGLLILMMSKPTALNLVGRMTGETCGELDDLAQSAVAEMANVISGRGGVFLAALGRETTISPPVVLIGPHNGAISTPSIPMFTFPLETVCGAIELQVALSENL